MSNTLVQIYNLYATQSWCTQFFLSDLGYLQQTGGTLIGQLICKQETC